MKKKTQIKQRPSRYEFYLLRFLLLQLFRNSISFKVQPSIPYSSFSKRVFICAQVPELRRFCMWYTVCGAVPATAQQRITYLRELDLNLKLCMILRAIPLPLLFFRIGNGCGWPGGGWQGDDRKILESTSIALMWKMMMGFEEIFGGGGCVCVFVCSIIKSFLCDGSLVERSIIFFLAFSKGFRFFFLPKPYPHGYTQFCIYFLLLSKSNKKCRLGRRRRRTLSLEMEIKICIPRWNFAISRCQATNAQIYIELTWLVGDLESGWQDMCHLLLCKVFIFFWAVQWFSF